MPRPAHEWIRPGSARPASAEAAGHFGEFLQGCLGPGGSVALITVPTEALRVCVWYVPAACFELHTPDGPAIAKAQAAALFRAIVKGPPRGRLVVRSDMPVGGGAGSSTAALVGVARALAVAFRQPIPQAGALAALCLSVEGASDPLMHASPERLLWASRMGTILSRLPPVPKMEVVGGFAGPGRRTDPRDRNFADISDLLAEWRGAATRGDAETLAALATASAMRNARHRGEDDLQPLISAGRAIGALGLVAAHTGSARGLIFAPHRGDPQGAAERLQALGLSRILRFSVGAQA